MEAQSASFPSLFWPHQPFKGEQPLSDPWTGWRHLAHVGERRKQDSQSLQLAWKQKMAIKVVFSGSGGGVTKTITCVEIMKHCVVGLHQVSQFHSKTVTEIWERTPQGCRDYPWRRQFLLSNDPLDAQEPGYQPPQTLRVPAEDGERGLRMLLQPALGPSAKFTAKKACPDYWSACSPHSG